MQMSLPPRPPAPPCLPRHLAKLPARPTCSKRYVRPPCRKKRYSTAMSRQGTRSCWCSRCKAADVHEVSMKPACRRKHHCTLRAPCLHPTKLQYARRA